MLPGYVFVWSTRAASAREGGSGGERA